MLSVRIPLMAMCTTLCDKVRQWLATGRWFSPGTPVSSTNKTDRHNITEILLKVALNTTINNIALLIRSCWSKINTSNVKTRVVNEIRVFTKKVHVIRWLCGTNQMLSFFLCWQLTSIIENAIHFVRITQLAADPKGPTIITVLYPAIVWFWVLIKGSNKLQC